MSRKIKAKLIKDLLFLSCLSTLSSVLYTILNRKSLNSRKLFLHLWYCLLTTWQECIVFTRFSLAIKSPINLFLKIKLGLTGHQLGSFSRDVFNVLFLLISWPKLTSEQMKRKFCVWSTEQHVRNSTLPSSARSAAPLQWCAKRP